MAMQNLRVEINNFLEFRSVDEANTVSLEDYVFLERLSAERGTFCFKIRQRYK